MKHFFPVIWLLVVHSAYSQTQVCPLNSNWSSGTLTHWEAYTGNNAGGNPSTDTLTYDSTKAAPAGTLGSSIIYEFNLPSVAGIQILSFSTNDLFGGFQTVPKINGYQYTNSILLGSTSITRSNSGGSGGGYVRGVSYRINVPPGPVTVPYTMTYAYAMVLENGTHNSSQQPLFTATLMDANGVITCASPKYFLPTLNNTTDRGTGATLDSALARSEGFVLSQRPSPNSDPNSTSPNASHLQDVWWKGWTEVTFDLSPYRGQQVTLTFETDNCVPGGHFAYSYVALRNVCGGLQISGDSVACIGSTLMYSIPGLTGATYQWTVPAGWTVVSGADSSILQVKVGNNPGAITANEQNSCANLLASLNLTTSLPTIAGAVNGGLEVCAGTNAVTLTETGNLGNVLSWLASTDGVVWTPVNDTTTQLIAQNLTTTTNFRALIQNGQSCDIDTSSGTTVLVDPQSVGGKLEPSNLQFCQGQNKDALLQLIGATGTPVNWQSSPDDITWTGFAPVDTDTLYSLVGLVAPTQYRVIVKSGVCPADTSSIANINYVNIPFPQASIDPADTAICYGTPANLKTIIQIGTNYAWTNAGSLIGSGNQVVSGLPFVINPIARPKSTIDYVISIENAGCPNLLLDTFHVRVLPPIVVDAGR